MGCSASKSDTSSSEPDFDDLILPPVKAAVLIQQWYRRCMAQVEEKRRYSWSIFQNLEYASELDQLKLYDFFNSLLEQMNKGVDSDKDVLSALSGITQSPEHMKSKSDEDLMLYKVTDPQSVTVNPTYNGPTLRLPITTEQVEKLIDAFKQDKLLHAKYVLEVMHEVRGRLKTMPNVRHATTKGPGKQVTVVGDLHGKLEDLCNIFYKNGLPSEKNCYIINGDFVDRGEHSVEIAVIFFCFLLLYPNSFFLNRGNHEDIVMNLRYGLIKEIMAKYKQHAKMLRYIFEDVFSWLPLATIIDNKVLVAHGGISSNTDLKYLGSINRHKYLSLLQPPYIDNDRSKGFNTAEWKQLLDLLWSDPKSKQGCYPNTLRNGGSFWGPDITKEVLKRHKLELLIRSHECKEEGYEFTHDNMVLTLFSASNYYEVGSNKGAYVKFGPDLKPRLFQFIVTRLTHEKLSNKKKVNLVEDSAVKVLKAKVYANERVIIEECRKYDVDNSGTITPSEWCEVLQEVLQMELPWRRLRDRLVSVTANGKILYKSTFEDFDVKTKGKSTDQQQMSTTLYRNVDNLETIFRAMDKDNSGYLSQKEFEEACQLLSRHSKSPMSKQDIEAMGRSMDFNNDGLIDFNEFLEAFRIVDKLGKESGR